MSKRITYGHKIGRRNSYHVTGYTVETKQTIGGKKVAAANGWGQDGLRNAKHYITFQARHRRVKKVVFNQTRGRYVGKNRVRE